MNNFNGNLVKFLSLILFLSAVAIIASQKFLQAILTQSVTYCQGVLETLSIPIPHNTGEIFLIFLVLLFILASVRLLSIAMKMHFLQKNLSAHILKHSKLEKLLKELDMSQNTVLIQSDKPFGFCFGIRQPKVYVSTEAVRMLNTQELKALLLHERSHLRNKDTIVMFLGIIAEFLFPFFPLFSDLLRNFRIEKEIKADREAVQTLGSTAPLVSVLKKLLSFDTPNRFVFASSIADDDTLEPRIRALGTKKYTFKRFQVRNVILSGVCLTIFTLILALPVEAVEVHHEEHDIMLLSTRHTIRSNSCHVKMNQIENTLQALTLPR